MATSIEGQRIGEETQEPLKEELMISVSGVRGVVGSALTPEIAARYAQAFGTYLKCRVPSAECREDTEGKAVTRHPCILLARDTRRSGEMLRFAVLAGLLGTGCDVIDLGVVPTPTLQLAIPHHQADGAVCITASHNPIQWNALKLFRPNGMYLTGAQGLRAKEIYESGKFHCQRWEGLGSLSFDTEAVQRHIEKILRHVDADLIRVRRFRVALDCCCGAGGVIFPTLLERLGCEVIPLHCDLSGLFPHDPEPIAENLGDLCAHVKQSGADVGIATDADVDRVSLVTEKGAALGEESSLVFAVNFVLSQRQGAVVTNLSTSMAIDDVARGHGAAVHRTPVGEVNVAERMIEVGAVIGGEGNGGIINPQVHFTRDAPAGAALILHCLAASGLTVSQLAASLPRYHIIKKTIHFPREKAKAMLAAIHQTIAADEVDERDGLKFLWRDRWVHVRASGTEPIVRVIAEARDATTAERLCAETLEKVLRYAQ